MGGRGKQERGQPAKREGKRRIPSSSSSSSSSQETSPPPSTTTTTTSSKRAKVSDTTTSKSTKSNTTTQRHQHNPQHSRKRPSQSSDEETGAHRSDRRHSYSTDVHTKAPEVVDPVAVSRQVLRSFVLGSALDDMPTQQQFMSFFSLKYRHSPVVGGVLELMQQHRSATRSIVKANIDAYTAACYSSTRHDTPPPTTTATTASTTASTTATTATATTATADHHDVKHPHADAVTLDDALAFLRSSITKTNLDIKQAKDEQQLLLDSCASIRSGISLQGLRKLLDVDVDVDLAKDVLQTLVDRDSGKSPPSES